MPNAVSVVHSIATAKGDGLNQVDLAERDCNPIKRGDFSPNVALSYSSMA